MIQLFSKSMFCRRGLSFFITVLIVLTMNISVLSSHAEEGLAKTTHGVNDEANIKASAYLDDEKKDMLISPVSKFIDGYMGIEVTLQDNEIVNVMDSVPLSKSEEDRHILTIEIPDSYDANVLLFNSQQIKTFAASNIFIEFKTPAGSISLSTLKLSRSTVLKNKLFKDRENYIKLKISKPFDNESMYFEDSKSQNGNMLKISPLNYSISVACEDRSVKIDELDFHWEKSLNFQTQLESPSDISGIQLDDQLRVIHAPSRVSFSNQQKSIIIYTKRSGTYSGMISYVTFTDIDKDKNKAWIEALASKIIIQGATKDLFKGEASITKAEFIAFLLKGLGVKPVMNETKYQDVKTSNAYYGYIVALEKNKWLNDSGSKKFYPDAKLTRSDVSSIIGSLIHYYSGIKSLSDSDAEKVLAKYKDQKTISKDSRKNLALCISLGIVNPSSKDSINLKENLSRSEGTAIIYRFLKEIGYIY